MITVTIKAAVVHLWFQNIYLMSDLYNKSKMSTKCGTLPHYPHPPPTPPPSLPINLPYIKLLYLIIPNYF